MNDSSQDPPPQHGDSEHVLVLEASASPSWLPLAAAAVPGSAQCRQQTGKTKNVTLRPQALLEVPSPPAHRCLRVTEHDNSWF